MICPTDVKQIYCINPECRARANKHTLDRCQSCGAPLLVQERYRLVRPLRDILSAHHTEVFEVEDWGTDERDWGTIKVMKILKYDRNPDLVRLF